MGGGTSKERANNETICHNGLIVDLMTRFGGSALKRKIRKAIRDHGLQILKEEDHNGFLPLYHAAPNSDLFGFLIDQGADINFLHSNPNYEDGLSMLHSAVLERDFSKVKFFIEHGINIDLTDSSRRTPFHFALRIAKEDEGEPEAILKILNYLLDSGCSLDRQSTIDRLINEISNEDLKQNILSSISERITRDGEIVLPDFFATAAVPDLTLDREEEEEEEEKTIELYPNALVATAGTTRLMPDDQTPEIGFGRL